MQLVNSFWLKISLKIPLSIDMYPLNAENKFAEPD